MNIIPKITSNIELSKDAKDIIKLALEKQIKKGQKNPVSLQALKAATDAGDVFQKAGKIIKQK